MTLTTWMAGEAPTVLGALATSMAKASLILAAAVVLTRLMRRQSAAARHVVWALAIGSAAVMPFAAQILPEWNVALPESISSRVSSFAREAQPVRIIDEPRRALAGDRDAATLSAPVITPQAEFATASDSAPAARFSSGAILFWLYLAVTAVFVLRLLASLISVARLTGTARTIATPSWLSLLQESSRSVGLHRSVRLLTSPHARVPMTWGVFDPVVLLTPDHEEWTVTRRRSVLRHELAHVARWDAATQIATQVCCAVYWFNPLMWIAARALRVERERACDDRVLAAGMRAGDYAGELLDIARTAIGDERHGVALAMARRSQIEGRLLSILDPGVRRGALRPRSAAGMCAAAIALALPLAAFRPTQQQVPVPPTTPRPETQQVPVAPSPPRPATQQVPIAPAAPRPATKQVPVPITPTHAPQAPPRPAPPTTAHIASPAGAPSPVRQVAPITTKIASLCGPSRHESSSSHSSSHDDGRLQTWDVSWNGDNCDVEMHTRGAVTFTDDLTDVATVSPAGFIQFASRQGKSERALDIRMDGSTLRRAYSVDGKSAAYDDDARAWLAAFLIDLDRHTGFKAESRAASILRQKGPSGLLDEIDQLSTDNVRDTYYKKLFADPSLSRVDVRRALRTAAATMTSDHDLGQVLEAVPNRYITSDQEIALAYVEATARMTSDHERGDALVRVAETGSLPAETQLRVIDLASRMHSDHEITTVLIALVEHHVLRDDARQAYTRAADQLTSSYSRQRVMNALKR